MSDFSRRFGGTQRLYGEHETHILNNSHVCVVGIGGVGSWVAEGLARTAIGELTLIDLDDICTTNTNRQIHALSTTVGESKIDVMAERIKSINPDIKIHLIEDFVAADNTAHCIKTTYDYVVDATDSVRAKAAMIAFCKRNNPIITVGGAGGQLDPTQVNVCDLAKTTQDPLAAKLRNY